MAQCNAYHGDCSKGLLHVDGLIERAAASMIPHPIAKHIYGCISSEIDANSFKYTFLEV